MVAQVTAQLTHFIQRSYVMLLIFLAAFSMAAAGAHAQTTDDARHFADGVGKQVLDILNTGGDQSQKQQQLRQVFSTNVDIDWMAQFVIGPAWSQLQQPQRDQYVQAYREYLLSRYTNRFSDYNGSGYKITNVKDNGDGKFMVEMQINAPKAEDQDIAAGYRVQTNDKGQFRISDIIVEGVSLITTQRSEFNSVIQRDGIQGLINSLNAKARQG